MKPEDNKPIPLPIRTYLIDLLCIIGVCKCFNGKIDLCLVLTFEIIARKVGPHETGFFCEDISLRLPYRESTVSLGGLIFYAITLNAVVVSSLITSNINQLVFQVFLVELYRVVQMRDGPFSKYEQYRPDWQRVLIRFCIFFGKSLDQDLLILSF